MPAPKCPRRGEAHPHAKLNGAQVREIRRLYREWKDAGSRKGYADLAAIFGVNWATIRDVVTNRSWIHIPTGP